MNTRIWSAHQSCEKICPACNSAFRALNRAQVYCTDHCRNKAASRREKDRHWTDPRSCIVCQNTFSISTPLQSNRKTCSDECAVRRRQSIRANWQKCNTSMQSAYNEIRYRRNGKDTLKNRLYRKYSDLPRCCESCGLAELEILEFAHKPEHKRNGAYQSMKFYERHMFWVLCPNDHKRLDKGLKTPSELKLT